jgi:hypothetical protein
LPSPSSSSWFIATLRCKKHFAHAVFLLCSFFLFLFLSTSSSSSSSARRATCTTQVQVLSLYVYYYVKYTITNRRDIWLIHVSVSVFPVATSWFSVVVISTWYKVLDWSFKIWYQLGNNVKDRVYCTMGRRDAWRNRSIRRS